MNKYITFKTLWGYIVSLVNRFTPLDLGGDTIEKIYNFQAITESLYTSGQPTEDQLMLIQQAGFDVVVNLAPHGVENALDDEESIVSILGMKYYHIPVDFKNPQRKDYARFVKLLSSLKNKRVWLHCAANMRVSAFMYLYRTQVFKESKDVVKEDMYEIWQPFGVWEKFISEMERKARKRKKLEKAKREDKKTKLLKSTNGSST